jgi:cytochrome P450
MVYHPDHVRHVLIDNARNYFKGKTHDLMRIWTGQTLASAEGELWRRQRRIMNPAFARPNIARLFAAMVACTEELVSRLAGQLHVDMHQEMMLTTLNIVTRTLFGATISESQIAAIERGVVEGSKAMIKMYFGGLPLPYFIPTPTHRSLARAIALMDEVIFALIEERRQKSAPEWDLLGLLLDGKDEETGERMSIQQVRDEMIGLLLAGHETMANGLSWTWVMLGREPAVLERVLEEIDAQVAKRTPTFEDVQRLTYTHAVLQETLRLYPPAWSTARTAAADDVIAGHLIRKGELVLVCPIVTHRDPRFWPDPERFDPQRFLAPQPDRQRHAFYPFGAGQHTCIGNHFAITEGILILTMTLQSFLPQLSSEYRICAEPLLTLRPKGGVPLSLSRRG